jgi:hypothetical protein
MAITFIGAVKSPVTIGNDSTLQNIFTIENGIASRVNLNIRRLLFQNDSILTMTTVMPLVKTSRATAISGGVILEKNKFDTTQSPDANVIFRSQIFESARIAATPGTVVWQQYPNRMHTGVEQQYSENQNLLPRMVADSGREFKIRPGESLLSQVVSPAVTTNAALKDNWFVECVWEEDSISTFTISGTVTLNSSPVTGAQVTVIQADDVNMTNPILVGVYTTPAGGAWSATILSGHVGFAYVQYNNGGTYYTAPGSPYLT